MGDQLPEGEDVIKIRWLIRRDMAEVLEIERNSFEFAWSEENFLSTLRHRVCVGMVAEHKNADNEHQVVGYMVYELHRTKIHVLNFAVHPEFRRKLVGTAMLDKMKSKMSEQRRKEMLLEVRETNVEAQLFFKSQGFKAVGVLRSYFDETTEDAYLMRWSVVDDEEPLDSRSDAEIRRAVEQYNKRKAM